MARVPSKVQDLLDFCNEHDVVWQAASGSVGLSAPQLAAYKSALSEATSAVTAQSAARSGAKAATILANDRVKALRASVAGMIRTITTYADTQADPLAVYAEAQIDPPSPRSPSEPPGQPTNITATLDDEGNITLRWKCVNPEGGNVVYIINRRDGGTGNFTQVGVSGSRVFLDDSLAAGPAIVQYQIRAYRGQTQGPASPIFTLQFGRTGTGMLTLIGTKLAA